MRWSWQVETPGALRLITPLLAGVIVWTVVDDALSPDFPVGELDGVASHGDLLPIPHSGSEHRA